MQAHKISGVVMDIAAFKVSHSVDIDATALRAARARSSSIGAMDESSRKAQKASHTKPARLAYTLVLVSVAVLVSPER